MKIIPDTQKCSSPDTPTANKTHSIQFTILTSFIVILLLTTIPMITYMHTRHAATLMQLADELMSRASEAIIEQTTDYLKPAIAMVEMSARLASETKTFSLRPGTDTEKRAIAILKQYPQLAMFNMGDENGNFLMPKKMPDGTIATKHIEADADNPRTTWIYRDRNGQVVRTEQLDTIDYDPRLRPWYANAKDNEGINWTDMYILFTDKSPGITVSCPLRNAQGQFIGVFGIDIVLDSMSSFLQTLKVGERGIAFIINSQDELVAYPDITRIVREHNGKPTPARVDEIGEPRVARCIEEYRANTKSRFTFTADGITYIGSVTSFPKSFDNDWKIAMVVPRNEFIGSLRDTARNTLLVAGIILVIAIIVAGILSRSISHPVTVLADEARQLQNFRFDSTISPNSHIREIRELQSALGCAKIALAAFGKYVPGELVRQLVNRGQAAHIGGQREELTVFFSDIQGFTPISELLEPEPLMNHLSEYFDHATNVISTHRGTVDKYIGDAVMAFWGAPTPESDHAYLACLAALDYQQRVQQLNAKWTAEGKVILPTRIGIHSGEVIVGNMGSAERMNYSVLGDAVNIASRLEGAGKVYGTTIIAGETVYQKTADRMIFRPLDRVAVLGRKQSIMIYELLGNKEDELTETIVQLCDSFTTALEAYFRRDWAEALNLFHAIQIKFPQDRPTQLFIERCRTMSANPPGNDWDGTTRLTTK